MHRHLLTKSMTACRYNISLRSCSISSSQAINPNGDSYCVGKARISGGGCSGGSPISNYYSFGGIYDWIVYDEQSGGSYSAETSTCHECAIIYTMRRALYQHMPSGNVLKGT